MRAFCFALKKCKNACPCNPQGQFGLEKGAHFGFSLFGGKPRTHRKTLGVNLTQGSREAQRKRYYLSPIQPLSHGVFILNRRASSPCTGEPRTHRKTLGVNLTQGSREAQRKRYYLSPIQPLSQNLRFCQLPLHRGAESRSRSERCDFLPFRGGAAAAAEGVVIYRLPCRTVLFCAEKSASRQDSRAK